MWKYKLMVALFDAACFATVLAAGGWLLSILVNMGTEVLA